jgi:hypothetical protein
LQIVQDARFWKRVWKPSARKWVHALEPALLARTAQPSGWAVLSTRTFYQHSDGRATAIDMYRERVRCKSSVGVCSVECRRARQREQHRERIGLRRPREGCRIPVAARYQVLN